MSKPIPLSQTTLRDHYAAVALQACIGRLPLLTTQPNGLADGGDLGGLVVSPEDRGRIMRGMARAAYGYADAMLAIRDAEPQASEPVAEAAPPQPARPTASKPSNGETTIPADCQCYSCMVRRAIEQTFSRVANGIGR